MMDYAVQPSCAARRGGQNSIRETLGEYLPAAQHTIATKTPSHHYKLDTSPSQRQIGSPPPVSAVNAS
jgi:hypothetical protein